MEEVQQKNWFGRNWLWVLPVSGCLILVLVFVFGIGAAYFGVSNVIKNATPYEYALDLAKNNSDVQAALGESIDSDGIFQGNISINNDRGEADLKIPIKGEYGKGTLFVLAEKIDGEWIYEQLYVLIKETQEDINLLDQSLEGE